MIRIDPKREVSFMLNSRDYGDWRVTLVEWTDGEFSVNFDEDRPEWGVPQEFDEDFGTTSPTVTDLLVRLDDVITARSEAAHERMIENFYSA